MERRNFTKLLAGGLALGLSGSAYSQTSWNVTKGVYMASERSDVIQALRKYAPRKIFCDLGSGDGRVMQWAKEVGAKEVHGIEYEDMATDIKGDIFDQDLSKYNLLYYFGCGASQEIRLMAKIQEEFKGFLIVNGAHRTSHLIEQYLGKPLEIIDEVRVWEFK